VSLTAILVFALATLLAGWLLPVRWRWWFLLAASVLAAYWLQPSTPVRNLDFWFPTASILLTAVTWAVTRTPLAQRGGVGWRYGPGCSLDPGVALLRYAGLPAA